MSAAVSDVAQLWHKQLVFGERGPKSCPSNAIVLLTQHPAWAGLLQWDAFAERVRLTRAPPWSEATKAHGFFDSDDWRESDTTRFIDWAQRTPNACVNLSATCVEQAVRVVAERSAIHPVREYLAALRWDGKQRLPTWLSTYAGVEANEYASEVGRRWLISAVARAMDPGCQVDCVLILEGLEGSGKSSLFRALVPDDRWYSETGVTLGDKDSYQALHGVWLFLLDELDSIRRSDTTRVKNFVTSRKDHYREPYGRRARDFRRQNVFCGTTNEHEYLPGGTNRRFWPVRVSRLVDIAAVMRDRDQLWAEAVTRYDGKEKWHADTPELRALCDEQQRLRQSEDPWTQPIATWLKGQPVSMGILTHDILEKCLESKRSDNKDSDVMRVGKIMRLLGYERGPQKRENGEHVRRWVLTPQR